MSVVSVGELRRGFVVLPPGKRRTDLERWFEHDLLPRFQGRILPVTRSIAERWGVLDGERQLRGSPLNTADGMIADGDGAMRRRLRQWPGRVCGTAAA
jgi:predicted nucleic acid-binding protein